MTAPAPIPNGPDHVTGEELRAAEAAGAIPPGAAAAALAFAASRRDAQGLRGDEPLPLFRGVNDLLMALGVVVGGAGMLALTGAIGNGAVKATVALALLVPVAVFARVFARRRAELPGILAALGGALLLAMAIAEGAGRILPPPDARTATDPVLFFALPGAALIWGLWSRAALGAAFPLALIALGLAGLCSAGVDAALHWPFPDPWGPARPLYAAALGAGGLLAAAAGLRRDMSDPLRATYRATEAFWLHASGALMLGGAISLGLIHGMGETRGVPAAAALGLPLTLYALIIDRRSFLTLAAAWVGWYAARLARGLDFGSDAQMAAAATLTLGLMLLGLALGWSPIRRALMRALPRFPGKDRLPPWDAASAARR